jgi:hypothetical protein
MNELFIGIALSVMLIIIGVVVAFGTVVWVLTSFA